VLALHLDESGHHGTDAERFHVAAEDAGQQRRGEGAHHLIAEVAAHKAGNGFIRFRNG